jgi:hypothetical protein
MKEIPLTQGYVALVDDGDYQRINQFKWHVKINRRADGSIRAVYAKSCAKGITKNVRMHRFLLGVSDPEVQVDHEDRNGLNNQRHNLRIASSQQNQCNRPKQNNNVSGFKGVFWNSQKQRWNAKIQHENKQVHIGFFMKVEEAARAYDKAAQKLHGKFAALNFKN